MLKMKLHSFTGYLLSGFMGATTLAAPQATEQKPYLNNETDYVSEVYYQGAPFWLEIEEVSMESDALRIQSPATAQLGNKLIFVGGKVTGFHGFVPCPDDTFPPADFNKSIHIYDTDTETWMSRLITEDKTLTSMDISELSAMNFLHTQDGDHLIIVGGYGLHDFDIDPINAYRTFKRLKVMNLPGVIAWVEGTANTLSAAVDFIDSPEGWGCSDDTPDGEDPCFFQLTGGELMKVDGVFWMLVGQSYTNGYGTKVANSEGPCPHTLSSIQIYARGFRGFTLDYSQSPTTADPSFWREQEPDAEPGSDEYYANQTWKSDWGRRRDLNVLEAMLPKEKDVHIEGAVALSGVFTLPAPHQDGAWTIPAIFHPDKNPEQSRTIDDPAALHQGFNIYDSPAFTLWSAENQTNWFVVLGGIGYQNIDENDNMYWSSSFDYSNHAHTVRWDVNRNDWTQHLLQHPASDDPEDAYEVMLAQYPPSGEELPFQGNYNGTETCYFPAPGFGELIDLDAITERTHVATLYGGIASPTQAGTKVDGTANGTFASNRMFKVYVSPGCIADINQDGQVNGFDIGTLLAEWNNTVPLGVFNKSDLNRDGIVNGEDLGLMLDAWGKCNEDG